MTMTQYVNETKQLNTEINAKLQKLKNFFGDGLYEMSISDLELFEPELPKKSERLAELHKAAVNEPWYPEYLKSVGA